MLSWRFLLLKKINFYSFVPSLSHGATYQIRTDDPRFTKKIHVVDVRFLACLSHFSMIGA